MVRLTTQHRPTPPLQVSSSTRSKRRYSVAVDWPGLRTHPVQRFLHLVVYVEQTDPVDVLRVLHAHRDSHPGRRDRHLAARSGHHAVGGGRQTGQTLSNLSSVTNSA